MLDSVLFLRFDNDVEVNELALLLLLLGLDYFLESVAFFALILYLLIDKTEVEGLTGFLALDEEGVEGIDGVEEREVVDGTVEIEPLDIELFCVIKEALINGSLSNFQSS